MAEAKSVRQRRHLEAGNMDWEEIRKDVVSLLLLRTKILCRLSILWKCIAWDKVMSSASPF